MIAFEKVGSSGGRLSMALFMVKRHQRSLYLSSQPLSTIPTGNGELWRCYPCTFGTRLISRATFCFDPSSQSSFLISFSRSHALCIVCTLLPPPTLTGRRHTGVASFLRPPRTFLPAQSSGVGFHSGFTNSCQFDATKIEI